jgi:IS30 family transposase
MPRTQNSKPLSLEEKEKIKTFYAIGKSYNSIGRGLNRSPHTIKRYLLCPEAQEQVEVIKKELADMYEELARRMLISITDEDVQKISAYQRVIASGISVDKMRLLRDLSTENIDTKIAISNIDTLIKECNQALER